ncbi:glycoside hydrolase family 18 protein [Auricularia subglabra TFB-10046 SS5]|nr:glycoside hydrolase family 18 protein [Auricularia subglabra TFB-10046 SS5]
MAAPTPAPLNSTLAARAPAAPHWVVYHDKWQNANNGFPTVDQLRGWNVLNLAFWITAGPWDNVQAWVWLTDAQRAELKASYATTGIKVVVSAFGSSEVPTTAGTNPATVANNLANFVKTYNLDGVDVDYEDFNAFDSHSGSAENWLIDFTRALRAALPAPQYILTHAPVAPWFSPGIWGGGGYLKVHNAVGNLIDWYNIQFYNQNDYNSCDTLLNKSGAQWPKSSVFEIAASGVPLDKIVIGKPGGAGDANNGIMPTSTLAQCVSQAKSRGWNAGVMAWQYPNANAQWIAAVRGSAFPV